MREWRNWQARRAQASVLVRVCGFDSRLPYSVSRLLFPAVEGVVGDDPLLFPVVAVGDVGGWSAHTVPGRFVVDEVVVGDDVQDGVHHWSWCFRDGVARVWPWYLLPRSGPYGCVAGDTIGVKQICPTRRPGLRRMG